MIRLLALAFIVSIPLLTGCGSNTSDPDPWTGLPDWTEATHGNSTAPDFEAVFPEDAVQRIDIVIDESDWQAMLDDMTAKYGPFGQGGGPPPPDVDNPIWVSGSLFHEGIEWYHVGVRFKGNSSLYSAWRGHVMKLPFKLDFDQFEDEWPDITNQRFYGFKQLSLSNGFKDPSLMREHVAAGIFREAGLAVAHTVPCRVFVDHGEGAEYFGLYTLVEVVDDTLTETQFAEGGNLYKPEGLGASFSDGSFNENYFEKKSNESTSDWSDIQTIFETLHASNRQSDPEAWREGLESVFDMDGFIRWLAVNTLIQNWDSYGRMTQNYYLYHDPADDRITWIPWDLNESLSVGPADNHAIALDLSDVEYAWPLINYIVEDASAEDENDYWDRYLARIEEVAHGAFAPERMIPIYEAMHALIAPYVVGDEGEREGFTFLQFDSDFLTEPATLSLHVQGRYDLAIELLGSY